MRYSRRDEPVDTNIDPKRHYTNTDLGEIADELLRQHSKSELCADCFQPGRLTGKTTPKEQPVKDGSGNTLVLDFDELSCANAHFWVTGEGKKRGIDGESPILFEEHLHSRRRREIYCTVGQPDPSIVVGLYNRSHPQGRKINTPEARARHGASYYK